MNKKVKELRFGTGGAPLTTETVKGESKTVSAIKRLSELGLNHLELEFVYSVFIKTTKDKQEIKKIAEDLDVSLTAHGSYYTNFGSPEDKKFYASLSRLNKAAQTLNEVGGKSITFHSGFFTGQEESVVLERVIEAFEKFFEDESNQDLEVVIAPELTGKASQFGSIEQLISLTTELQSRFNLDRNKFKFCIDFAHKHARNIGKFKTPDEYRQMFDLIISKLGEDFLDGLHMHFSAINYGPKGERNHLTLLPSFEAYKKDYGIDLPEIEPFYDELRKKDRLDEGEQDWKGLLKVLKEYKVTGFLVCESPNLEHDALLLQKFYREI